MGRLRARSRISEDAHQVHGVGGNLRLGGLVVLELAESGVGPGGGFQHLLLLQHLGCVFEALMLQQPLHQLPPGILGRLFRSGIRARQQHPALDVDQ